MSYNESLSPNSNYPPMSQSQWDSAPFNEIVVPEKKFDITCCQTLSRTAVVTTNNYIPGAEGCDYEPNGEGGYCSFGWQDPDDTFGTDWSKEYESNGYKTPLQLIQMLQEYLEKDLREIQKDMLPNDRSFKATKVRMLKGLIEECECWTEDETDFEQD